MTDREENLIRIDPHPDFGDDPDRVLREFVAGLDEAPPLRPTSGFSMKVEPLEVTTTYRSYSTMKWLGKGPRPRYTAWRGRWEWIRTRIFRLRPQWRLYTFDDMAEEGLPDA